MTLKQWGALVGFVALCEGAGIVGSIFTTPEIGGWYTTLVRPELAPPNWVFGPVWTTLFALMGLALFLVWRAPRRSKTVAYTCFAIQLVLNVLWSYIFFGLHNPGGAVVGVAFLWVAIFCTIFTFAKISKTAALLLVPYLAWVSFASYLNYMIWVLNS